MEAVVTAIQSFLPQVNDAKNALLGIFAALVALALLAILFGRIGGK